jgi:hypothetical protein
MHAFAITGPAPPGGPSSARTATHRYRTGHPPASGRPPTGVRTRPPLAPTWRGPTPGALIISEGTD